MSALQGQRPPAGAQPGQSSAAGPSASAPSGPLHEQPQPVASSSRNPQLGPHPYFRYPTPTPDQIEEELPPYWEDENVPLGPLLDRLARKSYSDMRTLVEKTLPPLAPRQKPKHVIEYAKTTRQAVLKYLAVLRWKMSVDLATTTQPHANGLPAAAAFPTPHSNGESNNTSPVAFPSKGKGRVDGTAEEPVVRGKVTDARRIQHFLEHQNQQQEAAITHIRHVTGMIDMLRERNADLLTALSLQSTGTYSRLPAQLMEDWVPRAPLQPPAVLANIERLNEHTRYRLRCVDYVPPDLVVERVADGRVYARGGGENGWIAQLSLEGFEEDSKWWLCGFEWAWKVDGAESPKPFSTPELNQILAMCNHEVLAPQEGEGDNVDEGDANADKAKVDAPLVRVYNFLQHLSLAYQLEVLYSQALAMTQGRWRGQLQVEIDRTKKELRLRYWIRQRTQAPPVAAPGVKRPPQAPTVSSVNNQRPMVGGTLTFTLAEATSPMSEAERVLREVAVCGAEPADRTVRFELGIKWEVGEAGTGGGLKAGEAMDASGLKIDPSSLSMKGIVTAATRAHAAHLSRVNTTPLLTNERLILDPLNPPRMEESESSSTRPVSLVVPLPSRGQLSIAVSSISGLLEIEDSIARDNGQVMENNRTLRAKLATNSSNEQKTRLADDVYRLVSAIIVEDIEDNLRQLGLHPLRRVALRTNDLSKTDLHPSTTVFVPLPVSQNHYFVAKVTTKGIAYELLKLLRVPMEGNGGMKMSVGERIPIDLAKLVERRAAKGAKRNLDGEETSADMAMLKWESAAGKSGPFQVHARDLRDMFTYCNALVAQTMVEQQLKDRGIPYTAQFPDEDDFAVPRSRSALAGMVPNLCVNASHLFKDGRAAEVASPKVFLVIKNWWSGSQCNVETIVRLRHQPSLDSQPAAPVARASDAGRAEGITFDQNTLTVRFHAPSIARCVPDFLEQWERLSKVIVVAGEVNRLNKQEEFRDIRMLSFDLCTASVQYAPGFNVAITYTPTSDSYEASFSRTAVHGATPALGGPHSDGGDNPHAALAPLLSAHLNELTQLAPVGGRGHAGRDFLQLLRATLPLLLEAEALRVASASPYPALVVRSVMEYRLVWDHEAKTPARYALDVLLTQAGSARFLLCDATRRKDVPEDLTCGPLTPIPNIANAMLKGFQAAKIAKVSTPSGPAGTPRTPNPKTPGKGITPKEARVKTITPVMPPAARLDGGESMICSLGVMHEVLRAISNEIEISIGGVPMGPGSARG
ncbi:hypothetical protein CC85DRAFT_270293 [Cutaneotrichosporon oleaginosum]|uniref:Mediator of RNA polymerase II transcription subunit 14 n=1 Tax=Cutaneotrichosporon oleaginosum TaxID=879819 RepID=A0A0J0XUM8_9TREE|nr:uncharacterized protein CC85DRAFT_270293 [Cutaneotrichosporon oleaginosum]KLT44780.1 hypothetical protein CC85DRAFT_270293 [Cutaneotrichosporon oleaginosum]TXT11921.1 hypothetical protein COLE_02331 [Cutaneotrichosporon oleaginosum]